MNTTFRPGRRSGTCCLLLSLLAGLVLSPAATADGTLPMPAGAVVPATSTGASEDPAASLLAYQTRLETIEASEGPASPALDEVLLDLAGFLQQQGNHSQARAHLQRLRQLVRAREGLDSPLQLDLSERMVTSLKALGDNDSVEQELLHQIDLLSRQPGESQRLARLQHDLAKWHLDAFYHDLETGETTSLARHLSTAQGYLLEAIGRLTDEGHWDFRQLDRLEDSLTETYFLAAWQEELRLDPDYVLNRAPADRNRVSRRQQAEPPHRLVSLNDGVNSFRRRLAYLDETGTASRQDYAAVLIGLADWKLSFNRREDALKIYREAWTLLEQQQSERLAEWLQPETPVSLPEFLSAPGEQMNVCRYSREAACPEEFIDLAFSLNRYGRATRIRQMNPGPAHDPVIVNRLIAEVRATQFRPRFSEGEASETEVTVRYRLGASMDEFAGL